VRVIRYCDSPSNFNLSHSDCEKCNFKMSKVGRPNRIDKKILSEILIKHKNEIVKEDSRIISKSNPIWINIGAELNNIMTPNALYTFVTCNKFGIRDKLCEDENIQDENIQEDENREDIYETIKEDENLYRNKNGEEDSDKSKSMSIFDSTNESNVRLSNVDGVTTFTITIPKNDYVSMIIHRRYRRVEKNRPVCTREYTVLQPGLWQHIFNEKIWQATKISCAFNFKRHKLLRNAESGYACGTCKCGSVIKCVINNSEELVTKLKCIYVEGQGHCGKRYLRNPIRQAVVEKLQGTSAAKYRIEMAENLMQEDDDKEPPCLYSTNVLRVAKHEITQKNYIDKDPLKALHLMKLGSLKNIIHTIGLNPFFVHYWSNHQLHVYRTYALDETSCVYIDATGSIIRKIKRPDKTKTKHIFFIIVLQIPKQVVSFQYVRCFRKVHNTNAIQYWLMEWIRSGAPCPREVVCDANRALLTAAVRCFTGYLTVEEYSDACK